MTKSNDGGGYRNPPKKSQFKKGQSGNPKGRPNGTRNFKTDVKSILNIPIKTTSNGKQRKISTQEATLLHLRAKALNGNDRALDRMLTLAQTYNNEELATSAMHSSNDKELIKIYKERLTSGAAGGEDYIKDPLVDSQHSLDPDDSPFDDIEESWKLSGIDDQPDGSED